MSTLPLAVLGPLEVRSGCRGHDAAAARVGRRAPTTLLRRRRAVVLAPLLPYLTGAWETLWFALAGLPLPLAARALVFLRLFHALLAIVVLPLSLLQWLTCWPTHSG